MKTNGKIPLLLLISICIIFNFSAVANEPISKSENNESNNIQAIRNSLTSSDSDYDLNLMNLQIDVLGIVFFGPQVALDFQFANMIAVGPYVRWHYAGVLYQGVVTDWFSDETTTSLASYSFGVQAKILIPVGSGQHRPYVGFGFERSNGSDSWDPGGTWGKRIYEYKSNVFSINLGYRLLTNSAFNLSAGIGIGISKDVESIGYYEFGDEETDNYNLETRVLPMVQLILGWQLGGN